MGRIVTAEITGNITRPPYRSVSPPTTMRPREPTTTGTATSRATSDSLSVPMLPVARNSGPRGLIRAHAQKLTANPVVAMASISHGDLRTEESADDGATEVGATVASMLIAPVDATR